MDFVLGQFIPDQPLAPTKEEVAKDPGKFDGTSFDPLIQVVSRKAIDNFSESDKKDELSISVFADWLKLDKPGALSWFKNQHEGHELNLDKLSDAQKAKLK